MKENFVHLLIYDIATWSAKLAFISFVYSISHFYAFLIFGLNVIKYVADQIILYKEHKALLKARERYQKSLQLQNTLPMVDFGNEDLEEVKQSEPPKVH